MQTVERLYDLFQPEHYSLTLNLDRVQRRFLGTVVIAGQATGHKLGLHAKDLAITKLTVNGKAASYQAGQDDCLFITPDHPVSGATEIKIEFDGRITDAMHGLYPCYYQHDGQQKELLATQFESHHAREVFPCVDEPAAKASFDLTLQTETGVQVLGNMPIKQQAEHGEKLVTSFETTPRMSSYLLAFVVGELQSKSTTTKDGVVVSTWATKAQPASSLDFGLDVAKRAIEFFNDYFGVAYPLPKADHVALPDFSSGAMENWGLITYREVCLLADESTAVSSREYIATVIAHETSHQWFGNLVTMAWWDDLWLNESFATLMEYVCVDALFPEWHIWMTFATHEALAALRRDYLPGIQAIKVDVNHPDEVSTLFDPSIVYAKGARTLAMCRAYVGDEAFRQGLSDYFQSHKFGNTHGQDLWRALGAASQLDVAGFMTPWIEQSGLPRLKVTRQNDRLVLSQQPFIIPAPEQIPQQLWPIPLGGGDLPAVMTEAQLDLPLDDQLVRLNRGALTHAVFDYDQSLRHQLIEAVVTDRLEPVDRLSLLHDCSLLARSGDQSATDLLEMLDSYRQETEEPVWDIISLSIADIRRLVETDTEAEAGLKRRVSQLAQPSYQRLGWQKKDNEPDSDTKLRATVIGLLAYADDPKVIEQALSDFAEADQLIRLPAELRPIVFGLVVKHGSQESIERLIDCHHQTANSELQNDIVAGLTASRDEALISRLIGFLKDDSVVRRQDIFRWFAQLMRNRYARDQAWRWLIDSWPWIEKNFAGDKSYDDFARYSAAGLSTYDWLDEYRRFFNEKRQITALARTIELGEADIKVRADWHKRDSQKLTALLTDER